VQTDQPIDELDARAAARAATPSLAKGADAATTDRLDALELQAMDAELAQAALDAVVIRHGEDIARLQRGIEALQQRLDTLANRAGSEGGAGDESPSSLADALERERPPHY